MGQALRVHFPYTPDVRCIRGACARLGRGRYGTTALRLPMIDLSLDSCWMVTVTV
jgi:hypothetical protein